MLPLPMEGGCRCGKVRLRVSAAPLLSMACHCGGCQKMTGSAFSLAVAIPTPGFQVIAGEPVPGGLHGPNRHMHCGWCMSWLYSLPFGLDFFVNVHTPALDEAGAAPFAPFIETFTAEKLPWASTPASHSYAAFPAPDEYPLLMQAYAARHFAA